MALIHWTVVIIVDLAPTVRRALAMISARSGLTSAIMLPPRPPPLSLAPSAPALRATCDQPVQVRAGDGHGLKQLMNSGSSNPPTEVAAPALDSDAGAFCEVSDLVEDLLPMRNFSLPETPYVRD